MENLNNLPPFYVGQKIEAVCNHSNLCYRKGDQFIVKAIKIKSCCNRYVFNIGISTKYANIECSHCGSIRKNDDYYSPENFRPLQESGFPSLTFKEVIKETQKLTCLN